MVIIEPIKLDSAYWFNEINKTKLELAQIVNGDLSGVKTAKSDEDSTTLQDIDKIVRVKMKYISYCEEQYEDALNKEKQVQKKSILYFDREYGY